MKTVNTCWVKTLRATGILVSITNQMFKISFPLSGIWDHSSVLWRKQNSASENISRVYWIAGACLEIWIDKYFLKIIFYIAIVGHCRWTTDVESCSCDFWFLIFEVWSFRFFILVMVPVRFSQIFWTFFFCILCLYYNFSPRINPA